MGATSADVDPSSIGEADIYRLMVMMRRFEETAGQLYALGFVDAEPKLSIGREALFAGLIQARQLGDPIVIGRRCHGVLLALGVSVDVLFAELVQPTRGIFDRPQDAADDPRENGLPTQFYRSEGAIETLLGRAISLAMFNRLRVSTDVVFVILEGDALTLAIFETPLKFAVRWNLPIVFIVDHASPGAAAPGGGHAMRHPLQSDANVGFCIVDGIDYRKVVEACDAAACSARSGAGPQGLVVSTQVFRGHASKSAPGAAPATSDPLLLSRNRIADLGLEAAGVVDTIDAEVRDLVRQAGLAARTLAES